MSIKNSDENVGIRWFGSTSATVIAQERAFRPGHIPRGPTSAFHVTTSRGAMTTKSQLKSISSVIRPQAAVADKVTLPKSTSLPSSTGIFSAN